MASKKKEKWAKELRRFLEPHTLSLITGVEISTPKSWEPASNMLSLKRKGLNIEEIARKTGYSVPTVERNLKTEGKDPRTGP